MLPSCLTSHYFYYEKNFACTSQKCSTLPSTSMVVYQYVCPCDYQYLGRTSQTCPTELINTFLDAKEVTKDQRKICQIENAKPLAPLLSTMILQSNSIYWRIKNVPNITTMHNFPFWLQKILRSIYQF